MKGVSIALAVAGWVLCVAGAVLAATRALQIRQDVDATPYIHGNKRSADVALWLTIGGATVGLVGTVWSLVG